LSKITSNRALPLFLDKIYIIGGIVHGILAKELSAGRFLNSEEEMGIRRVNRIRNCGSENYYHEQNGNGEYRNIGSKRAGISFGLPGNTASVQNVHAVDC
jgi:hypothetical protein